MIREIRYKDHEEWLALRRQLGIGGSEAGAVMGLDPYKSPYTLWAEKTGRIPEFAGNLTTRVGSYLEELVARLWCEETGKKVRRRNAIVVNDDYPCAFADVDRMVVGENALLECKTTSSLPVMRSVRGGEFPDRWYCQMMHYLMVTGCDRAYLAVLVNSREFYSFVLERDEEEIRILADAEATFWRQVQTDTPPAPDGNPSTAEALETIYAGGNRETAQLFGREKLLAEYFSLKADREALDRRMAEICNTLKADMGDAEKGLCGSYSVSWAPQQRRTFDAGRFAAAHPEVDLTPFYKTTTARVFRVKNNMQ